MIMLHFCLYAASNIFCIFLLAVIYYHLTFNIGQQTSIIMFRRLVAVLLAISVLDIGWEYIYLFVTPPRFQILGYLLNTVYAVIVGLVGLYWLLFVEEQSYDSHDRKRFSRYKLVLLLPIAAFGFITLTSVVNGCVLYFDESGRYVNGPLFPLMLAVPFMYLMLATADLILDYRNITNRQNRKSTLTLLSFLAFPSLGAFVGFFLPEMPTIWTMFTFSIFVVFINLQNERMSTDWLTGTNNRRRFDNYLDDALEKSDADKPQVCLLMADIDEFKTINDSFGHSVGDKALKETADILKKICRVDAAFLARYGGDEFAVIRRVADEADARNFCREVQTSFANEEKNIDSTYRLAISIGMSCTGPDHPKDAETLIKEADGKLYQEKRRRK